MDAEQEVILAQHGNFQLAITRYLNKKNNPVIRGGSIAGHIMINRDRKSTDHRLFYDYFTENPRYIKIGESTTIESLKRFCHAIVEEFAGEYLRSPNATDIARLLRIGKYRGFPGMLGSLDCMH
ncbi:hypothetical protein Ddye_018744 [Dipteronia dyeriana]|uniref:Uncharacterized protein n=1 Tax=Dipteronia dyeriana TaxID=168575 RepID=A0AAD9X258_9ROSI|nr:hypothetical protein Ddye_018744 [Dipteronia dyeriana]